MVSGAENPSKTALLEAHIKPGNKPKLCQESLSKSPTRYRAGRAVPVSSARRIIASAALRLCGPMESCNSALDVKPIESVSQRRSSASIAVACSTGMAHDLITREIKT